MSLFHNAREIQMIINPRKRKVSVEVENNIVVQESYSCDLCNDEYDSETDLHFHRKTKHKVAVNKMLLDENVCKTCIKKHESREHLIKHIKTFHLFSSEDSEYVEREIFICDICHLIYFNKLMLSIHIQYFHDKASRDHASNDCPKCNRSIQVKNAWFHFQRHSTQSTGSCPICLKKFKNRIQLSYHVQKHPRYFKCNICQYNANNKQQFDIHMKSHNDVCTVKIKEENFKCYFVPQINTRTSYFNAGLRGYMLSVLRICVVCRAICTKEKETMSDHISCYHRVVQPVPQVKKMYICSCSESFSNKILLRHHVFKMKSDDHRPCN